MILRALTLWRPWAMAIAAGPKRVENRSWAPGAQLPIGSLLAIHAGRRFDAAALAWVRELWPAVPDDPALHPEGIVAIARLVEVERVVRPPLTPWDAGPWCWRLDQVWGLRFPVPARGAQGLWTLPDEAARGLAAEHARRFGAAGH